MVIEQLKKHLSAVASKETKEVGALTTSLEQAVKEVGKLRKVREAAKRELGKLCEDVEHFEYEPGRLQAKLKIVCHERGKYVDAINRVRSGVGELQEYLAKVFLLCKKR